MKNKTRFSHSNKTILILFTVLSLLECSLVFADGVSSTRPTTRAEKDFSISILNALAKAVPPDLQGWEKSMDSTEIKELDRVDAGVNKPLELRYQIIWQDTRRLEEAQAQQVQELAKLYQKPGVTQKDIEELQKKVATHDVKVQINVSANILSQSFFKKINPAPAIAGGLVCLYPSEYNENYGWIEGSTYVFLGKNWKMNSVSYGDTDVIFTPVKSIASSTIVQNIVVIIQADPKRTEQLIKKIDWEALKKLIKD